MEWAELSNIKDITNPRLESNSDEDLNWNAIWDVLKSQQDRSCSSLKKSKALIFRIKCLNKLLPTRDICYLRQPKLYQGDICIACFIAKETFSYLAECIVY